MIAPLLLLTASAVALALSFAVPAFSDLVLLAGPCLVASLFLLLRALFRARSRRAIAKRGWIMIDGSNVMHWKEGVPDISTVREVVEHLAGLGYTPGVVFDANAGYKMADRYLGDGALAKALGLSRKQVIVVPKGTPADPTILSACRDLQARVVSNDRFRDWGEAYPEIGQKGHLVRGGYRRGGLWLDLEAGV